MNYETVFPEGYRLSGLEIVWKKRACTELFYCNLRIIPLSVASHRFSPAPANIARNETAR